MVCPNIVTLYNSPNCGAFLQAYSLGEALRNLTGACPRYVETGARSPRRSFPSVLKAAVKSRDFNRFAFEKKKADAYCSLLANYQVVASDNVFGQDDLLVFGSDEIWNLQRREIFNFPTLWGEGIVGGGVRVSYAPSANGTDFTALPNVEGFCASLRGFDLLSARDETTSQSVAKLTGKNAEVVCDPTLLLDQAEFRQIGIAPDFEHFILVYSYGTKMTSEEIASVKKFAQSRGLKLVSAGQSLNWCDFSLPSGPLEFLGLVDKADFVVTDTFHGSVFSSIFHKKFASFARGNAKVVEYLDSYHLGKFSATAITLERCLDSIPDYSGFDAARAEMKSRSLAYLSNAVSLCESKLAQS